MSSHHSNVQRDAPSTSLASPSLLKLAEAVPHEIDSALMDYLLIELVDTFKASAAVKHARSVMHEQDMIKAGLLPEHVSKRKDAQNASPDPDQLLLDRLEGAGRHVGSNLTERLTRDRPRFAEPLDTIKFICKDVWISCWGKQVDNLRTNHRGIYIIQDNSFRPILRLSSWDGDADTLKHAKIHVTFALGIIRGVMQRLGLSGSITPDLTQPPQCGFQIKLSK